MKGRKPKPTALRIIEGNREHRTIHAELEPKPPVSKPPIPPALTKAARKHWNYLLKQLSGMKTLAVCDQGTVMAAAISFGQVVDTQRDVEKLIPSEGIPDPETRKEILALRRLINATTANLVRFEAELGLNPTARTRVKIEGPKAQTLKEKLIG